MKTTSTSLILLFALVAVTMYAQGDGPRSHLPMPTGVWGVAAKYLHMNQNLLPVGNFLVPDADINVDVFPTTFFHSFGLKGRPAVVQFMINPGSASGKVNLPNAPINQVNANGLSDGFVAFKLGLVGTPALNVVEYAQHPMEFTLNSYFRVWYSGSYDSKKTLNMGSNRFAIELGAPMAIPLNGNPTRATWLEVFPCVQFYTDNNDPIRPAADKTEQAPLFLLENHLSHNFTPKFWAGADLRYQYGGRTTVDGLQDDNLINIVGGGISAGYQILPYLGANATYGTILAGDNNAESEFIRLTVVFTYVNLKKLNPTPPRS